MATITLTGTEIVYVYPVAANGMLSAQSPIQTTTAAIAALAGGSMPATPYSGQVTIAVSGTAVQLSPTAVTLINGMVLTAGPNNAAITTTSGGTGGVFGFSSGVNNKTDGTGNGQIIQPGASTGVVGGVNLNTIYVNGVAGDIFSFAGN